MHYLIQGATAVFGHVESVTDIRIANGIITEVGTGLSLQPGEQVLNAVDCVVYPGFVNTHHHLAQSVLKAVPEGMNQGLADWLMNVPYRFWPHIDPDLMYASALLGFYELLRSGTSTCADHHYLYHQDTPVELEDALWQAARDIGIRFTLCRGGATITGSHKGMQKAKLNPESLEQMLARLERSVSRYHQDNAQAMQRVIVAPTSLIHGAAPDHLTELARFARANKLRLHSHLLEVGFDEQQAQLKYGKSAVAYAESVEWLGPDVYFAHLVQATSDDIEQLAKTGTGISHCPTSNCRLGSGIAALIAMQDAGMPISVGVDGSASSENASMLQELNLAWLIHRSQHGPDATQVEQVISWGTRGGAEILGLNNVGEISVGMAADLTLFDISGLRYAGMHSALHAPLMAGEPAHVKYGIIDGRLRTHQGEVIGLDESQLKENIIKGLHRLKQKITA